jgi:replicative DNA helicase
VALAAAEAVAEAGDGVHVFSLEDSWRAYADRNLARRSGVPAERIRSAQLQRQDLGPLTAAIAALRRHDRWIFDDRGGLSAAEIIRSVRRHRERLRTRLVIVDYVQLVRRNPRLDENAALDEIMTAFAAAAKDDDGAIAWLVLSQLNRKVEERADKRPLLSDLRGSGALEERAKVAVGLYRGAYYHAEPQKEIDYDCTCVGKTPPGGCTHPPVGRGVRAAAAVAALEEQQRPVRARVRDLVRPNHGGPMTVKVQIKELVKPHRQTDDDARSN